MIKIIKNDFHETKFCFHELFLIKVKYFRNASEICCPNDVKRYFLSVSSDLDRSSHRRCSVKNGVL